MQLMLIVGIVFAIGAVLFALQNNVPVMVDNAIALKPGAADPVR